MSNITLKQAIAKQKQLEVSILDLIKTFQAEADLIVDDINITLPYFETFADGTGFDHKLRVYIHVLFS